MERKHSWYCSVTNGLKIKSCLSLERLHNRACSGTQVFKIKAPSFCGTDTLLNLSSYTRLQNKSPVFVLLQTLWLWFRPSPLGSVVLSVGSVLCCFVLLQTLWLWFRPSPLSSVVRFCPVPPCSSSPCVSGCGIDHGGGRALSLLLRGHRPPRHHIWWQVLHTFQNHCSHCHLAHDTFMWFLFDDMLTICWSRSYHSPVIIVPVMCDYRIRVTCS